MLDFSLNLASLALTLSLGAATPTGLLPRQEWDGTRPGPAIECDGLLFPNYPTCLTLIEQNWSGTNTICADPRSCHVYSGPGNCRISWCNNEDSQVCRPADDIQQRALAIVDTCQPQTAGGYQSAGEPEPWTEVALRPTLASLLAIEPQNESSRITSVNKKFISLEENAQEVKAIEDAAASLKPTLAQRQQSGDNEFVVTSSSTNIERPGAQFPVSGSVPSGSWTLQETESTSTSITASVDLGSSFFETMSASIGLSVSADFTVSSAVGITINVDCPGQGVVLWAPLHDYYEGRFEPSGEEAWVYVPKEQSATLDNYYVRCLG